MKWIACGCGCKGLLLKDPDGNCVAVVVPNTNGTWRVETDSKQPMSDEPFYSVEDAKAWALAVARLED